MSVPSVLIALLISFVFGSIRGDLMPSLLNLNGEWSPMVFNMTQSPWIKNIYKVIAPVPVNILYSDTYCPGKMVSIYVNDTFLMNSTSVPLNPGTCYPKIDFPAGTFALSNQFSHANFTLPIGEHWISAKVIQYDENIPDGVMYIRSYLSPLFSCNDQ